MYKSTKYANGDELEAAIEKGVGAYDAVSKPLLCDLVSANYVQNDNCFTYDFNTAILEELSKWETIEIEMSMDMSGLPTYSPYRPFYMPRFVLDYNELDGMFNVGFTQVLADSSNYQIFGNMFEIRNKYEKFIRLNYGIRATTGYSRPAPNKCNLKIWGIKKKS